MTQGSHRPGKVLKFDLGPGKLLEFRNSAICPRIVREFCKIALENVKIVLENTEIHQFFYHSFGFMPCAKENCVKIAEERGGARCSDSVYR